VGEIQREQADTISAGAQHSARTLVEQVASFLSEYGWQEVEQLGSAELTARYIKPSGRAIPVSEIERVVCAVKH
jgi:O-methyltransferase involved in polyketide biosynthesis